jgi:hypothetical protein
MQPMTKKNTANVLVLVARAKGAKVTERWNERAKSRAKKGH